MLTTNWHNKYENKSVGGSDDRPSNKPSETLCKNYCISLDKCNSFDYAKDPATNNSAVCIISEAHPDVEKTSTYKNLGKDGSMYNMHYIKNCSLNDETTCTSKNYCKWDNNTCISN